MLKEDLHKYTKIRILKNLRKFKKKGLSRLNKSQLIDILHFLIYHQFFSLTF